MTSPVGFVILSHEGDSKLPRLVSVLRREYPGCDIAVHHDFSQAPLSRGSIDRDILWVEKWRRTSWAKWAVVAGALSALELLRSSSQAEWFILLSASDYPIRKGSEVIAELAAAQCDAFVDLRALTEQGTAKARIVGAPNPQLNQFDNSGTRAIKRRFYLSPQLWLPILRVKPRPRLGKLTWRPLMEGRHPFHRGLGCFYGDHWFMANRKAVDTILERNVVNLRLRRHYRSRTQPDESYYQTVLANTPGLVICRDNRRFAEWNGGGAHPMALTTEQLPAMLGSGAYFARKFDENSSVLDQIDAFLASG